VAQTDAEPPRSRDLESTARRTPQSTPMDARRPILSWPIAFVAIMLVLVVVLGGAVLVMRQLTAPTITPLAANSTSVATAVPVAPAPTAQVAPLAPATFAPAVAVGSAPRPTSLPTPAPAAAAATSTSASAVAPTVGPAGAAAATPAIEPTPLPTVAPELRREIEDAYTRYWDARAEAAWTLDPSPLNEVATGDELLALRRDIDQLRTEGHAVKGEVQHQYTVVRVNLDEAQVLDRLRDFSIYVDATTKEPLPGQARPTEADAPLSTSLYFLHKVDGAWRVERGEPYANS
jgi:hypothetical protein